MAAYSHLDALRRSLAGWPAALVGLLTELLRGLDDRDQQRAREVRGLTDRLQGEAGVLEQLQGLVRTCANLTFAQVQKALAQATAAVSLHNQRLTDLAAPVADTDGANKAFVVAQATTLATSPASVTTALAQATAPISLNDQEVIEAGAPTTTTSLATRGYVDTLITAVNAAIAAVPSAPVVVSSRVSINVGPVYVGGEGATAQAAANLAGGAPVGAARSVSRIEFDLSTPDGAFNVRTTGYYSTDYGATWILIHADCTVVVFSGQRGAVATFAATTIPANALVQAEMISTGGDPAKQYTTSIR